MTSFGTTGIPSDTVSPSLSASTSTSTLTSPVLLLMDPPYGILNAIPIPILLCLRNVNDDVNDDVDDWRLVMPWMFMFMLNGLASTWTWTFSEVDERTIRVRVTVTVFNAAIIAMKRMNE